MMSNLRSLAALTATVAVVVLASSCETRRNAVAPRMGGPLAHYGSFECTPLKITGGGRIDYPPGSADKNPPASHEYETFGAHVIASAQVDANGTCLADDGALEPVDHRPAMAIDGHRVILTST